MLSALRGRGCSEWLGSDAMVHIAASPPSPPPARWVAQAQLVLGSLLATIPGLYFVWKIWSLFSFINEGDEFELYSAGTTPLHIPLSLPPSLPSLCPPFSLSLFFLPSHASFLPTVSAPL